MTTEATAENETAPATGAKHAALPDGQLFSMEWTMRENGAYGVRVRLTDPTHWSGVMIVRPGYAVVVRVGGTTAARHCSVGYDDEAKIVTFTLCDDPANRPSDGWTEEPNAGRGDG